MATLKTLRASDVQMRAPRKRDATLTLFLTS